MSKAEPTYQNEEQHSSFQGLQANRKLKKVAKNCSHQNSITTDKDRACEKRKQAISLRFHNFALLFSLLETPV